MKWYIYKDNIFINTIEADEEYVKDYCNRNNFIYISQDIVEIITSSPLQQQDISQLSSTQLREWKYDNESVIDWEEKVLTVTEASKLWQYYASEGNNKAMSLQTLISDAKKSIRESTPDY